MQEQTLYLLSEQEPMPSKKLQQLYREGWHYAYSSKFQQIFKKLHKFRRNWLVCVLRHILKRTYLWLAKSHVFLLVFFFKCFVVLVFGFGFFFLSYRMFFSLTWVFAILILLSKSTEMLLNRCWHSFTVVMAFSITLNMIDRGIRGKQARGIIL